MIRGEVSADRLVVIQIRLVSWRGEYSNEKAVIDTFFSGHISLPLEMIRTLELPLAEHRSFLVANDEPIIFDLYEGAVVWNDEEVPMLVVSAEGPPTVGMKLLYGSHLTIDIVDGGDVIISKRQP